MPNNYPPIADRPTALLLLDTDAVLQELDSNFQYGSAFPTGVGVLTI